ncbi:conserved hypothetical protein [Pyrenophora tritici-repentis Pt-1C-BFP]|uniref:DUF6590 domain-containing protein n=1 Tax=Pyrenophora tritici-repentis (strain Pt-1C-BFP) TaxID=426418 RepID=B2VV47_PYRTR|nr:uncharacterized protein PTRG_02230 [Pyrenophora tritici-repentis Pt-1C-BFP]EDU41668.1 conserved hypothetical protein [Pyrenophora tritici-repentis Pt-1C-BFP]
MIPSDQEYYSLQKKCGISSTPRRLCNFSSLNYSIWGQDGLADMFHFEILLVGSHPEHYGVNMDRKRQCVALARDPSPQRWNSAQNPRTPPGYYVRSRDFFIEGRVFAVIMNETAGDTSRPLDYNTSRSLNKVRFNNNWVYTNTRRFIVVRKKREFCYACPIFTYSGRATTKSGVVPGEHSIVYSRGTDPTLLNGEYGITKPPIVVDMTAGENYLQFASRIYFGIHHPIQYNVKVKDVGQVPEEAIPLLIGNWREENRADQDSRQSASVTDLAEVDEEDEAGEEEEEEEKPVDSYIYHARYNVKGYHPQISPYSYHPTHNLYGWHETLAPECYHPEHNKEGFHYTGNRCGYHSVSNPFGYNSQIAPDNYHPELNPEGYHSEKNPTGYHPISNPTVYSSKRNPHAYHQTKNPYGYSTVYYHAYHPVHNPHGYHYLHNPYGYDPNSNPTAYHPQYNPNGIRPPVVADSVGDITQALQVTTL